MSVDKSVDKSEKSRNQRVWVSRQCPTCQHWSTEGRQSRCVAAEGVPASFVVGGPGAVCTDYLPEPWADSALDRFLNAYRENPDSYPTVHPDFVAGLSDKPAQIRQVSGFVMPKRRRKSHV